MNFIANLIGAGRTPNVLASPYVTSKRRTLMLIGDSLTWGYGVTQAQAFPTLLQQTIDTVVGSSGTTAAFTARNVHADDIAVNRDGVTLKLTSDGTPTYDNNGPFGSSYSSTISSTGPAILLDGQNDGFYVTPSSSVRYLVLMVKATGSAGQTATISVYNGSTSSLIGSETVTVGETFLGPPGVRRIIIDAGSAISSFLVRRTDASGGAACRVLTVNPTSLYPSSGYVHVHINARGSYVPEDYSDDVSSILETIVHPAAESGGANTDPIFVLSLGTVAMYFSSSSASPPNDRRVIPSTFQTNLDTLVTNLKAAAPNSPIVLTLPPVPTGVWVVLSGYSRSQYDAAINSVAIYHNLPVIDLRDVLDSGDYIDGLHPNSGGHSKLATRYASGLSL